MNIFQKITNLSPIAPVLDAKPVYYLYFMVNDHHEFSGMVLVIQLFGTESPEILRVIYLPNLPYYPALNRCTYRQTNWMF